MTTTRGWKVLFITALMTTLTANQTAAEPEDGVDSWNRFHGPHGVGVVPGDALPTELVLANLAWKAVAPPGQSSPIVVGEEIVLTGADEDTFTIVSYDARSGREQWRHTVERKRHTEIYKDNDAASPTPATDGDVIYAYFPDFGLVAVSANGEEVWRYPMAAFRNHYGMASSPVLAEGLVLLLLDNQDQSLVLAVDRETGEKRWSSKRDREASWTTPLVLNSPSGQVLLTSGALWLDAYDAATGQELWSWFGVGHDALASPVYHDGTLYVLQGGAFSVPTYDSLLSLDQDGDGALSEHELSVNESLGPHAGGFDQDGDGLIAREEWDGFLENNSTGTHGLVAVDLPDPSKRPVGVRWRHEMGGAIVPSPAVVGDQVFVVRNGGIVASFDRQSGELLRRERLPDAKGRYFASPVGDEGKLYFASNEGKVSVVTTDADWSVLATSDLGSETSSTPAIRGSQVFVRTHDALMAFRTESS